MMEARDSMILIFSLLTILSLLFVLYGHYIGSEEHTVGGYISIVVVGLICWLFIGSVATVTKIDKEVKIGSLTRGEYEIYVSIKENNKSLLIFDKLIDFDNITDTTTFYVEEQRNMYNITLESNNWDYYYLVNGQKIYSNE